MCELVLCFNKSTIKYSNVTIVNTFIDDPHSTLYGSFRDGIFDGHIVYSDGETFTVDKVERFLGWDKRPKNFHSIIYSGKLVKRSLLLFASGYTVSGSCFMFSFWLSRLNVIRGLRYTASHPRNCIFYQNM